MRFRTHTIAAVIVTALSVTASAQTQVSNSEIPAAEINRILQGIEVTPDSEPTVEASSPQSVADAPSARSIRLTALAEAERAAEADPYPARSLEEIVGDIEASLAEFTDSPQEVPAPPQDFALREGGPEPSPLTFQEQLDTLEARIVILEEWPVMARREPITPEPEEG